MSATIRKVLVANRGVPAVRIMQTCMAHKIPTTAVYSTPDRLSLHVIMADSAVHIGEAPPREYDLSSVFAFILVLSLLGEGSIFLASARARREGAHG